MLFARQSHTLEEATTSYTLKSGRSPPPGFDRWFKYAKENQCLVDEYDRVHRDFAPFYEIASEHPAHFQQMVDQGREMVHGTGIPRHDDHPDPTWRGAFTPILPEMEFMLNGRDEPRVVFNTHAPAAQVDAMHLRDPNPFLIEPVPTSEFFKKHSGCDVLETPSGFVADPIQDVSCTSSLHCTFDYDSTSGFTVDLWPLLSMTKISPCFSDILFPGVYYYDKSWWSGGFMHPNDIPWADKQDKLYWRGMSNGGHIHGQNFRAFPRFRLIDIARNHSDLIDARMTGFAEMHCTTDDCDREGIIAEYNITGPPAPKEEVYGFKYLLDVDGNTFSGRYLGLLRSGGLVFKSTAFEEYFSDWLHPYVHYIPVRPDLSDLVDKIDWARTHEREARIIQETGRLFAQVVLTDAQNDCYFSAVLLEWARLQSFAAVLGNGIDVNATAV
ncbi:glycosyl transferase family 90-domain-containing protein [Mycena crocata]|nr:glycosyl transferase family 90-domain-containing protein [Mycena crocata]